MFPALLLLCQRRPGCFPVGRCVLCTSGGGNLVSPLRPESGPALGRRCRCSSCRFLFYVEINRLTIPSNLLLLSPYNVRTAAPSTRLLLPRDKTESEQHPMVHFPLLFPLRPRVVDRQLSRSSGLRGGLLVRPPGDYLGPRDTFLGLACSSSSRPHYFQHTPAGLPSIQFGEGSD